MRHNCHHFFPLLGQTVKTGDLFNFLVKSEENTLPSAFLFYKNKFLNNNKVGLIVSGCEFVKKKSFKSDNTGKSKSWFMKTFHHVGYNQMETSFKLQHFFRCVCGCKLHGMSSCLPTPHTYAYIRTHEHKWNWTCIRFKHKSKEHFELHVDINVLCHHLWTLL